MLSVSLATAKIHRTPKGTVVLNLDTAMSATVPVSPQRSTREVYGKPVELWLSRATIPRNQSRVVLCSTCMEMPFRSRNGTLHRRVGHQLKGTGEGYADEDGIRGQILALSRSMPHA